MAELASFRGVEFGVTSINIKGGKKGADHDKPWKDGGSPEDAGNSVLTISVEGFVSGRNYRADHSKVIRALEEKGEGEFVHPDGRRFTVLAVSWVDQENFNVVGFLPLQMEFKEVTFAPTPIVVESKDASVRFSIAEFVNKLADEFDRAMAFVDISEAEAIARDISTAAALVETRFGAALQGKLKQRFRTLHAVIGSTVSSLIPGQAGVIAANLAHLISLPSRSPRDVAPTLDVAGTYAETTAAVVEQLGTPKATPRATKHQAVVVELVLASCVSSTALTALSKPHRTRAQVFAAVEHVEQTAQTYLGQTMRQEAEYFAFSVPTQDRYQSSELVARELASIVSDTVEVLASRAFDAATERRLTLGRERTLLDLAVELYGSFDRIDELIEINAINEPLILKPGTQIVYYA